MAEISLHTKEPNHNGSKPSLSFQLVIFFLLLGKLWSTPTTWEQILLPRNRDFLQFPLTLASSFFSGTSRNRVGSKNRNKPIKKMFPCSRHSRSKASRPPASLCGNAFHDLQLFPTSSFFTRHLGEPAGLTQRKESSLGPN